MNPILGVLFHWLGGFASGSFYVPYRRVRNWSWETYWLVGGVFSWIIMPSLMAFLMTKNVLDVLQGQTGSTLGWAYLFGVLWGIGGLTFGLTMRYLGMSLGMGVALGYCAAFGTLLPPILKMVMPSVPVEENIVQIAATTSGQITLLGVVVCLVGIGVAALAGLTKEREMSDADKKKTIAEFNFPKGIAMATFSGIMSACFAFGLTAGKPIGDLTYCSGIVDSAAKQGKALSNGLLVADEQAASLIQTLHSKEFFKAAKAEVQSRPSLDAAIELLEAPVTLDAQIASLNVQLAEVPSGHKAELEKKIFQLKEELAAANSAQADRLRALKQVTGPLGERLQKYQANMEGLRGKVEDLTAIGGLKGLTRKEAAVAAVYSGADFLPIHKKIELWTGLPVLIIVLLGGFTTNFLWCGYLNFKNRSGYQYLAREVREEHAGDAKGGGEHGPSAAKASAGVKDLKVPVLNNYFFSALAGITWYLQFFFYTMGETQMGKYGFASWTLHMASIIIFSTMWGWILHEWKGASKKAHLLIAFGISLLILSTMIIGYGAWLKGGGTLH